MEGGTGIRGRIKESSRFASRVSYRVTTKIVMSPQKFCYLDNNATTRVAPEVVEALLPFLKESWGNPSSAYEFGKQVAKPLAQAREAVAALLNADPAEITFTSC